MYVLQAENDSRLSAQRWERQFRMEFEKNDALENEIAAVRTQCTMLQASSITIHTIWFVWDNVKIMISSQLVHTDRETNRDWPKSMLQVA